MADHTVSLGPVVELDLGFLPMMQKNRFQQSELSNERLRLLKETAGDMPAADACSIARELLGEYEADAPWYDLGAT